MVHQRNIAAVPMRMVGPIKIIGDEVNDEVMVPLATFESPLWPSTNRGAKISRLVGGIEAVLIDECMTRSIILEAPSALQAKKFIVDIKKHRLQAEKIIASGSRFARLKDWHFETAGNLIYLRVAIFSGDASGHNMATGAAESILNWLQEKYPKLQYVSISGNYCIDKKVSAVNGILGRGKSVTAEIYVPEAICKKVLRAEPEQLVNLHIKKNLLGSLLAGSLRTANAHFANVLLAFYIATGQDAANIVEGSQGFVHAEAKENGLYFSVNLPNIVVGTVGNGKHVEFAQENLLAMGCVGDHLKPGQGARRLAIIIAAAVLCGELSLLAAQTNPGELVRTHYVMERAGARKMEKASELV